MKTRPHFLTTVLAAFALHTIAEPAHCVDFAQSTGDLLYDDGAGNTLPYRLFLPEGYDANSSYPLVVYLHGAGERGRDNRLQASGGGHMENLYRATQGSTFGGEYKSLLLAPQCPANDQWVNWPWARGSYTQEEEPPEGKSMQSALAILDQVIADYPVNTKQVYVTGLSMGGFGTWDALKRRPGKFAAGMPLSGGGNKEQGALFATIPIWTYHGSSDGVVPVKGADELRDSIRSAGGSIEYTRIPTGHSGWSTFYNNRTYTNSQNQTVYEWLFTQTLDGPLAPFKITNFDISKTAEDNQTTIAWNSRTGRNYVIQTSDNQSDWTDFPLSIATNGATTSATVSGAADGPAQYYRVREGFPSADLLADSVVQWQVPVNDTLEASWNGNTEPEAAEFVTGGGIAVGFETRPDTFDPFIDTHVLDAMLSTNASIYLRYQLTVPADRQYLTLTLSMRYDDGFIAYLNGTKVASGNAPDIAQWNSTATASHSDSKAIVFEDFDLSEFVDLLKPGENNVLAIQGLNKTAGGSDFLIEPKLVGDFK